MDWIRAIIAFLLAVIIVGISSVAISTITGVISENSDIAGDQETNLNNFFTNFGNYVLTIFGFCIVAPLLYILLGGFQKGGGKEVCIGGQCYEY